MDNKDSAALYQIPVKRNDGSAVTLADYKDKVLLVVNVASQCGLTPQYEGLEKLHKTYADQGLAVLAFPANEFGAQEPGTNEEIKTFCETKFGISFPLFAKIIVKGDGQHPLYEYLTSSHPEVTKKPESRLFKFLEDKGLLGDPAAIHWNFEKFLISRDGRILWRFAPDIAPDDTVLIEAVESALGQ